MLYGSVSGSGTGTVMHSGSAKARSYFSCGSGFGSKLIACSTRMRCRTPLRTYWRRKRPCLAVPHSSSTRTGDATSSFPVAPLSPGATTVIIKVFLKRKCRENECQTVVCSLQGWGSGSAWIRINLSGAQTFHIGLLRIGYETYRY